MREQWSLRSFCLSGWSSDFLQRAGLAFIMEKIKTLCQNARDLKRPRQRLRSLTCDHVAPGQGTLMLRVGLAVEEQKFRFTFMGQACCLGSRCRVDGTPAHGGPVGCRARRNHGPQYRATGDFQRCPPLPKPGILDRW